MKLNFSMKRRIQRMQSFSRRTWLYIGAALLLLIILASVAIPRSVAVATTFVNRGEFIIDLSVTGEIEAQNSTNVSVPRMRRRMMLQIVDMAEEGTMVEKGDFLFQLDTSEAQQKVDEEKDKLENARAQLESEKASIASNMASLESALKSQEYSFEQSQLRLKMMEFEAEAKRQETELSLKKAEVNLKQAKQKIESQEIIDLATLKRAQLNVRQAEAELKEAEDALSKLSITAPIGGLVVYKEIWSGGSMKKVQVGDSPWWGMAVIGIPDLSVMMAKLTVNEVDISKIEKGQNGIVTVDALEGATFYGKITRVATLARRDRATNAKVFDIEVQLDSTNGQLRPGMTSNVRLITGRIADALTVPLQCVYEKEGETVVYVKRGSGFKPQTVLLGQKSSDRVVVLEGLKENDRVALRDPTVPLNEIGGESDAGQPQSNKSNKRNRSGGDRMIIIG